VSIRLKLLASVLLATHVACAQDVRVGVLGLFRPREIVTYHCCALDAARTAESENRT